MSATLDEEIDTFNAEKGAWLLKLPKHLFDVWSKAAPDQDLGYVTHNKATGEVSTYSQLSQFLLIFLF